MRPLTKRFFSLFLLFLLILPTIVSCGDSSKDVDAEFRDLSWAIGAGEPDAEDFVVFMEEGAGVEFAKKYDFDEEGQYLITLVYTSPTGKKTRHEVALSMIRDKEPPVIVGAEDLVSYLGEGIAYRTGVTVTDNCGGTLTLDVDSSAVDSKQAGIYPVIYVATDASGNQSSVTVNLQIYEERITKEMLFAALEPVVKKNIPTAGSIEMQARAVYNYVNLHVNYTAYSDKSDWIRAAYDGLRKGEGDCFTYFSLSKAFFEYLGFENMDVQRTPGLVQERHYWNLVNIGTAENPAWYHFDACRLLGAHHEGCLLTDLQVGAYTKMRVDDAGETNYFYAYDRSKYPASATEIVTPTPSLEPYY